MLTSSVWLPHEPAVCLCVCVCAHTALAASSNIIKWWWDGSHVSWAMENSCSISHFLSLSLPTLFLPSNSPAPPSASISVQTLCPLSPLNIQWCLSDLSLLGLSNPLGGHTNTRAHTHAQIQLVLTQTTGLSQHFNYLSQLSYNTEEPSSRGIERVVATITTVMSSCYSAQRFSTNTTNCTSNTIGLKTITCHHSVELFPLLFLVPLSPFFSFFSGTHTQAHTHTQYEEPCPQPNYSYSYIQDLHWIKFRWRTHVLQWYSCTFSQYTESLPTAHTNKVNLRFDQSLSKNERLFFLCVSVIFFFAIENM